MLDKLYENIGDKIKNWAKWIFIVEAIGAIITGLVLICTDEDLILYGLITLVCGPIVAWISSWILFAFGQLVEDMHTVREQEGEISNISKNLQIIAQPLIDEAHEKARRAAAERTKRLAEEKAKHEAEEAARREVEKKPEQTVPKKEKTLEEKLRYALLFQSDDGMIRYLQDIDDESVRLILQSPKNLVRENIELLLKNM